MSKGLALRTILSVFPMDIAPVMNSSLNSTLANTADTNSTMCQTTANVQESMQPSRVPQTSQLTGKTS